MMQAIAEVTSQFNLLDVTGDKLPEVNSKIFERFKAILEKDGIILESFTLVPNPDEVTKQAIQKVLDAQNALAQAKVEKEKALVEAEQAKITAKGKASAKPTTRLNTRLYIPSYAFLVVVSPCGLFVTAVI